MGGIRAALADDQLLMNVSAMKIRSAMQPIIAKTSSTSLVVISFSRLMPSERRARRTDHLKDACRNAPLFHGNVSHLSFRPNCTDTLESSHHQPLGRRVDVRTAHLKEA